MPSISVETMSGFQASVELCDSATLLDLWDAVEVQLDAPSKHLQLSLLVGDTVLPRDESSISMAGIEEGTRVSAMVRQGPALLKLPNVFELKMESSRSRFPEYRRFSSAFTIIYDLKVDVPASRVEATVMRKNDSDHFEIDGQRGAWSGETGHWMAGSKSVEEQSLPQFDLGALFRKWMGGAEVVLDSDDRVWALPSDEASADESLASESWVAPSSDCVELHVDAPLQLPPRSDLRVARVLVDASGFPVRAALHHVQEGVTSQNYHKPLRHSRSVQTAELHDIARNGNADLEEFDVTLACGVHA